MPRTTCKVRYLDRTGNTQISLFSNWWREQLNMFGVIVKYYPRDYDVQTDDPVYGEDLDKGFLPPREITLGANITNDASLLSKFGLIIDSDMTVYIHIDEFRTVFGVDAEPKSGDVIELIELGIDRPGIRGNPMFVVTERDENNVPLGMNPLMGHFLWFLKLKRFEFSHEPGITPERGTGNIDDQGPLPGDITDDSDPESRINRPGIPGEVDKLPGSGTNYTGHDDEVYGNY